MATCNTMAAIQPENEISNERQLCEDKVNNSSDFFIVICVTYHIYLINAPLIKCQREAK